MSERFDYAFVGAGLAALSLARALVESALPPGRIVLIDRRSEPVDRTIGAWFEAPPEWLGEVFERSWPTLSVATRAGLRDLEIGASYWILRSAKLHAFVRARLEPSAWSITWMCGEVEQVESSREGAAIRVRDQAEPLRARWCFDSREVFERAPSWQSFVALRVELERDHFDPERAWFMDLRLSQPALGLEFGQVLGTSRREALIYRVHVGPERRELAELDDYLELLGLADARIVAHEQGASPLDARPPTRRPSPSVLRIGVAGGRLAASSGYAFARMQRDAAAIVDSLGRRGHPFSLPRERSIYRLFAGVLLAILARRPQLGLAMFEAMWRPGHDARLFRLLDENASWLDLLGVMGSMPARLTLAGEGLRWLLAPAKRVPLELPEP